MMQQESRVWLTGLPLDAAYARQTSRLGWPRELPPITSAIRVRQQTPFGNMHIQITVDPRTECECEVFAQLGKGGDVATSDLEADLRFYEQHFGWRRVLTDKGPAAKAGPNLYGWPHNFVAGVQREVVWVHPRAAAEGSVAMIQLRGADGRDFSDRAGPPNFGWVSLRTWSDGKLARKSVADRRETSAPVDLFPYGCVVITSATSPSGVRVEQLTAAKGCP